MASLRDYERKRDRGKTPEPFGGRKKRARSPIFVVQRHDARSLHYDFRLERDGVLLSWAVPKGVPLETGQRHLAVHVEDHPLDYATFEGEIPKGQYGAGSVEMWDKGTYELLEEKPDGGLTVRLDGKRLQGIWTLVPAHLSGEEKNWLLIRKRDDAPSAPRRKGAEYAPMLATLAQELPGGNGWVFEVKWDGYRAISYLRGSEARLVSRNGNDLSERFPGVARALASAVKTPDCVLDGEVCALDENGRSSFSAMQRGDGTIVYYVFDLLELEGKPLIDLPLEERRETLAGLLDRRNRTVLLSETFDDGPGLLEAAAAQRLEGVIAKKLGSRYEPGRRSRNWLKVKTHGRQEFIIAGYTRGKGRRSGTLGSLILAVNRGQGLEYVGNCGTGFTEKEIDELLERLRPLVRKTSPFGYVPKMPKVRRDDIVWVEPKLVCEVEFAEWTHDGRLRAPSFQGLRDDKSAEEVRRERPVETEIRRGKRTLKLSNLDKVFFPEGGLTKGDLLAYYRDVAPALIPHLKERPFTMKRYPDGRDGKFFFQKDAPKHMPDWIESKAFLSTSRESRQKRMIRYPIVNDDLALLWMVNMGCIDMNVWYSRIDRPERPDFVLFDLDPSPDVGFKEVVQVALLVKDVLDTLGLEGYPKTSGSDGMHVLVPIQRRYTYSATREFAEIVAKTLERTHRGLVTTEWSKQKRRGVLIDANQNGEGKTIASVYSVRPREGAPVSTPLRWDEVTESLDPLDFTMDVVLGRIERNGDLFEAVLHGKQSIGKALDKLR
ncbi:MAG TPA: DNA ligase D [Gaiellaceae bacterium]|jgi:bifunctional non-homologous end joining protein LigD|nr:DNA ligase D [Gaiellaceae bacterium]